MRYFLIILGFLSSVQLSAGNSDEIIRKADSLINARQYYSAFQLLDDTDPININPDICIKKTRLVLDYFVLSIQHQMFALKNLGPDDNLMALRSSRGDANYDAQLFEIDSALYNLITHYPTDYRLHQTLAYYYHDVYMRFGEVSGMSADDLLGLANLYYTQATDKGINDPEAYYLMGYYQSYYQNFEAAIPHYLNAIKYKSPDPAAYYNLAVSYHYINDTNALTYALQAFEAYTDSSYKADAARLVAMSYAKKQAYPEAINYYTLSNDLAPYNYNTLKQTIDTRLMMAQPDEALKVAHHFFRIDPSNPTIAKDLIELYELYGYTDSIPFLFDAIIEDYHNYPEIKGNIYFHTAIYYLNRENYEQSRRNFKLAEEKFKLVFNPNHYVFDEIKRTLKQMPKRNKKR